MNIFGRTLKEYLWPVKYIVAGSVRVVISQYTVALPMQTVPIPTKLDAGAMGGDGRHVNNHARQGS